MPDSQSYTYSASLNPSATSAGSVDVADCLLRYGVCDGGGWWAYAAYSIPDYRWLIGSPFGGVLPPLGEAAWLEEFAQYKRSPEYSQVNAGMSLDAFKRIFYWEYGHRVLGRLIGLVYFVPLVFFVLTKRISARRLPGLLLIFILGGLQGLLGWYMVKSGLVDNPHVSQYRLTAHLSLAVVLYSALLWMTLSVAKGRSMFGSVNRGAGAGVRHCCAGL